MPDSKKTAPSPQPADQTSQTNQTPAQKPKQRHRRTMAELLQDPKYRAQHGLPVDDIPAPAKAPQKPAQKPQAKAQPAQKAGKQEQAGKTETPVEEPKARKAEDAKFPTTTKFNLRTKDKGDAPKPPHRRMYRSSWAFEVWNPSTEECLGTYELPDDVFDGSDALRYVRAYCNRHMAEVAGMNVVILEVHREFRVTVTQIETDE